MVQDMKQTSNLSPDPYAIFATLQIYSQHLFNPIIAYSFK